MSLCIFPLWFLIWESKSHFLISKGNRDKYLKVVHKCPEWGEVLGHSQQSLHSAKRNK